LDSLDYAAENLETLMAENSGYYLHFFAMFLLARFREPLAFLKLVRFLHRGRDELDFIMGDTLTEDYSAILCSAYNGDINLLREVIEDDSCDEFARGAAIKAYAYIVRDGHISRDEMTDYLRRVIRGLKDSDIAGASAVVEPKAKKKIGRNDPCPLLSGYPGLDPAVREGERTFTEFFSREAIEMDIPVYKALHHRAIPVWVRRDRKMVHYHADRWIRCLKELLEEYEDEIPEEQYAMLESVSRAMEHREPENAE
jgi:hypothetical protein